MDVEEITFHSLSFGHRPPMHILIIHQAFASLNEPGGTRHHEFARLLTTRGHKVTVIASPVSYITGTSFKVEDDQAGGGDVTILRATVYDAHHKSFLHRILAFFSFMLSSVHDTRPPTFQGRDS